jgi:hypothetical protein
LEQVSELVWVLVWVLVWAPGWVLALEPVLDLASEPA